MQRSQQTDGALPRELAGAAARLPPDAARERWPAAWYNEPGLAETNSESAKSALWYYMQWYSLRAERVWFLWKKYFSRETVFLIIMGKWGKFMDLVKTQHVKLVTDVNRTNYLLLIITVLKRLHQNPMVKNNHHTIYTDNISVCLILYTIYTINPKRFDSISKSCEKSAKYKCY